MASAARPAASRAPLAFLYPAPCKHLLSSARPSLVQHRQPNGLLLQHRQPNGLLLQHRQPNGLPRPPCSAPQVLRRSMASAQSPKRQYEREFARREAAQLRKMPSMRSKMAEQMLKADMDDFGLLPGEWWRAARLAAARRGAG